MARKLYQFENSPFCHKVKIVMAEKNLTYETVEVPRTDKRELIQISGQEAVPVLVDDGKVIVDSTFISKYLEETYPEPRIYPQKEADLGLALMIEDWADEVFCATRRQAFFESLKPAGEINQKVLDEALRMLQIHFSVLDKFLTGKKFLVADEYSIADISVYVQIQRLKNSMKMEIPAEYKKVQAWFDRVEQRNKIKV
jgi:glutathione S-transferase